MRGISKRRSTLERFIGGALLPWKRRKPREIAGSIAGLDVQRTVGIEEATRRFLLFIVVPLWQGAGLLDWWQHRRTHIEKTSGARESALHSLMLVEGGVPALAGLLLEVNAGVLLTALGALVAHEATTIWDIAYAQNRRPPSPTEQHIHSALEVLPFMATSLLIMLHWDQAAALFGRGDRKLSFALQMKRRPLPRYYIFGLLGALTAFGVLPYAEEFWRCYRENPSLAPLPERVEPEDNSVISSEAENELLELSGARGQQSRILTT